MAAFVKKLVEVTMKTGIASILGMVALCAIAAAPAAAEANRDAAGIGYEAIQAGNWAEAESQLRSELAKDPNNPMRLLNLAYVLQKAGRAKEAADIYTQVLQHNSDPLVAVGPDSDVRPMRAKIVAKKGMAALASGK